MKVKRCPLVFHNVLSTTVRCKTSEWHEVARDFRNAIIRNGLYSTGPIIYQTANLNFEKQEADYSFFIAVNTALDLPENDKYRFIEEWGFDDGLVFRHPDLDENVAITYDLLKEAADANELKLQEPFFNIYLDVFGDGLIDVYAPIVGDGKDD